MTHSNRQGSIEKNGTEAMCPGMLSIETGVQDEVNVRLLERTTGLVGIIVFFLIILVVGIWASRKAKNNSEEELMLAGRSLGFTVGSLTLIATWVGGGYINGAAEIMATRGLLWAQVTFGYSFSLLVGALLFIKPMRNLRCITLLDPFQRKYGNRLGALLFLPSIFGDIFWVASILNALGSSLVVITELEPIIAVLISVIFVASYTSVGAMYSVTYTDVVQLFFIVFGLVLSIPFVATNENVHHEEISTDKWVGRIDKIEVGEWIDTMLLLIFGGIPWQGYMQRILAIKSTKSAQYLSVFSMFGCAVMSIPSLYIGIATSTVNWKNVTHTNMTNYHPSDTLPLALRYLTPDAVAFFGLGAISAAVMSSADSGVLSFGAMFSRNLYKNVVRRNASENEVLWVLRITIVLMSCVAGVLALTISSVYYLSVLSSDLIYVILFPQLLLVIHFNKFINSYGCIASFIVGALLRILSGEYALGIPAVIKYPNYNYEKNHQRFPHRTLAMVITLITHVLVSLCANFLFRKKYIPEKYDFFQCFRKPDRDNVQMVETENEESLQQENGKEKVGISNETNQNNLSGKMK